jgi:hypothetical protein
MRWWSLVAEPLALGFPRMPQGQGPAEWTNVGAPGWVEAGPWTSCGEGAASDGGGWVGHTVGSTPGWIVECANPDGRPSNAARSAGVAVVGVHLARWPAPLNTQLV